MVKGFQLPNDQFWEKMQIKPSSIVDIDNDQICLSIIDRYPIEQLTRIAQLVSGYPSNTDKNTLVFIIVTIKEFQKLRRTLCILEKYLERASPKILYRVAEENEIDVSSTKRGTAVSILIENPELLLKIAIISNSYKKRVRTSYEFSDMGDNFKIEGYFDELHRIIEENISTKDKRARLDDPITEENVLLLNIAYEIGKRQTVEFDDWHYDKPIENVILEVNPQHKIISVKGRETPLSRKIIKLTHSVLTGKDEEPKKLGVSFNPEELDKLEFEREEFEGLSNIESSWKKASFADLPLTGSPVLIVEGENVKKAVSELLRRYGLELKKIDLIELVIEITFQKDGVEKTVLYILKSSEDAPYFKGDIQQDEMIKLRKIIEENL